MPIEFGLSIIIHITGFFKPRIVGGGDVSSGNKKGNHAGVIFFLPLLNYGSCQFGDGVLARQQQPHRIDMKVKKMAANPEAGRRFASTC